MPISLPFFKKKEKKKYFLVLLLREEKVHAVLLEELEGVMKIISKSQEFFTNSIEQASEEELLTVLDKAITDAESTLPLDFPTHQTVFGVKESWIEEGKIKKQNLSQLKKISEELGLTPIGFLVIHEAIGHFLKKQEGVPISTLLIETGKRSLSVSLIRAGRLLETKSALVEGSYSHTVDTLLKEFTSSEILPSKITIFNDDKNEEGMLQEFIGHSWSKSLPFLHVPQITSLPKDFGIYAVITASAAQMGFEVLGESDIKEKEETDVEPEEIANEKPAAMDSQKEIPVEEELIASTEPEGLNTKEILEESKPQLGEEDLSLEEFGFQKDVDIAEKQPEPIAEETYEPPAPPQEIIQTPTKSKESRSFSFAAFFSILGGVKNNISHMWHNYIKHHLKKTTFIFRLLPGKFLIPLIAIVIIFTGVFLWYVFGIKATVTLIIDPKVIQQTQDISFVTGAPSDYTKNTIAADFVNISEDGSVSETVSGKKEIGERAKGSITLYSRFTQDKTLPAGTVVTSSNKLQFTFDDAVKLSSAAAGASAQPSTAKANITAKQIGKESNLPSGTKFTVSSFDVSDIEGKNDSAFSGGTKKEITAVSKNDIQKALDDLPKQLTTKAKDDLSKKASSDDEILPMFVSQTVSKKDFDKKEGDESNSLTLKGTVDYVGVMYKRKDFVSYALSILSNRFPSNLSISPNIKESVKKIQKKNDNEVTANIEIQAHLLPKLENEKLASQITGKSFTDSEDLLLKLPQVSDVTITLSPNLSFLPKSLPRISKNIEIRTKVNE